MARYIVGSVGVYTPKYEGSNDALLKASLVAESSDPLLQSSFPRIEVYRFTEKKISPENFKQIRTVNDVVLAIEELL